MTGRGKHTHRRRIVHVTRCHSAARRGVPPASYCMRTGREGGAFRHPHSCSGGLACQSLQQYLSRSSRGQCSTCSSWSFPACIICEAGHRGQLVDQSAEASFARSNRTRASCCALRAAAGRRVLRAHLRNHTRQSVRQAVSQTGSRSASTCLQHAMCIVSCDVLSERSTAREWRMQQGHAAH
eukprot:COSAG06_NODE_210_length_20171_cov_14.683489_3_plen_182_part_00